MHKGFKLMSGTARALLVVLELLAEVRLVRAVLAPQLVHLLRPPLLALHQLALLVRQPALQNLHTSGCSSLLLRCSTQRNHRCGMRHDEWPDVFTAEELITRVLMLLKSAAPGRIGASNSHRALVLELRHARLQRARAVTTRAARGRGRAERVDGAARAAELLVQARDRVIALAHLVPQLVALAREVLHL